MAQKFSLSPGTAITRAFGAPDVNPKRSGFVVGRQVLPWSDLRPAKNCEIELVERNAESSLRRRSHQFPGKRNGFLLEVIAKGKIPEHLEKSVMAIGEADVLEIVVLSARAHAFLH